MVLSGIWYGHMEVWLDLKKLCLGPIKKKRVVSLGDLNQQHEF